MNTKTKGSAAAAVLCAGALAAGAFGCEEPRISEYEPRYGIITGTIFYPGGEKRGNVVVLLFREDNLPPPTGTGRPVNFIVVTERAMFHDIPAGVAGDFAAQFTMPTVGAGRYQVRAFLDADGDFNPTNDLLAQPTAGDVGGGHIDLDTRAFLPVVVENDKITANVTVTLGLEIPVERPVFAITSTATFEVPMATPKTIVLEAHPLMRGAVQMDPAKTAFLIQYADANADGVVDDVNGDHLPDLYPSVIFRLKQAATATVPIIIPGIINPFPYMDSLAVAGVALTTRLDVIIPPVSVELRGGMRVIRPTIPPGDYETILISGTGQTWTVPNPIDLLEPDPQDTSQSQLVVMVPGPALPRGRITGTVKTANDRRADAYVIAFDARNLPPPVGTGRPVALASITAASFTDAGGGTIEAPFTIAGLPDGNYVLRGFVDVERNFSPLVDLVAQPSSKDFGGGSTPAVVTISGGSGATGVVLDLSTPVLFDRPSFEFDEVSISIAALPSAITLRSHPIDVLGSTEETTKIPVTLGMGDAEGDNFTDLLPRVLLTRIVDAGGDPRLAPDDPEGIVIPGIVDPIPFMGLLSTGIPAVPSSELRVILPPVAVKLSAGGMRIPPKPGRYRVNLLSATGQTWSVPSNMDHLLRRVGTPLEDPTQARVVNIVDPGVPNGSIAGPINILGPVPAGDFSVIVFAFDKNNPPPPVGAGRPVASTVVPKLAFGGGASAMYTLRGLATGTYQVRAYLDADDDFTPWFGTMNQPDAGDIGGGYLLLPQPVLGDVPVDALGGETANIAVSILPPLTFSTDRPIFGITSPEEPVLDPAGQPLIVTLSALDEMSDVLVQHGTFAIQWVDLDMNGTAEDRNGDGNPDVFPLVVAELLDPEDETNQTVSPTGVRIPGIVSPLQFAPLGFPAMEPTATSSVVEASAMIVAFPPIAVDAALQRIPPPEGRYRITLVNARGQTWTIPNELVNARGTALPMTQGGYFTVRR